MADNGARNSRSAERRDAILSAAREVFIEHGFEDARIAEIGRRAGIAEGTVYLYYKTKTVLMEAVLADFWEGLTQGARDTTARHSAPLEQLRALADYHLTGVIRDLPFLDLAAKLRKAYSIDPQTRDRLRAYVAVFDAVYQAGISTGQFRDDLPLWIPRDMFYGTLEYSARTIALREAERPTGVVDNLIQAFQRTYGPAPTESLSEALIERLERAVEKIDPTPG
jgi:TetR/AcrR family fatty acid metabolism transcriptional regulator